MKPFEIRIPTETATDHALALKWDERRWCGNGGDILGYDSEKAAMHALATAKLVEPEPNQCYPVRGFSVS